MVKLGLLLDPSPLGHPLGSPLVSCQGAVGAPGHPYGMLRSWVGVLSPSRCRCWEWSSPISPTHSRTSQDPNKHQCRGDPIPGAAPGLEKDGLGSQSCVSQLGPTAAGRPVPAPGNSWELLGAPFPPCCCFLCGAAPPASPAPIPPSHRQDPRDRLGTLLSITGSGSSCPTTGASSSCTSRSCWKGAGYRVLSAAPGSFTPRCAVI